MSSFNIQNYAMAATWFRLMVGPVIAIMALSAEGNPWLRFAAGLLFGFAGFTDWFDGWYARKYSQTTSLGATFDQVADKILVVSVIFALVLIHTEWYIQIPCYLLVFRELLISGIRQASIEAEKSEISVVLLGKWKLGWQIGALVSLLLLRQDSLLYPYAVLSLLIALVLSIWSATGYLRAFWQRITQGL